jgi:ribosomal protein S18 acetylase RimI-like enzyme
VLRASGAFAEHEIEVALELVDAPSDVGYRFVIAEVEGALAGYACFGATPCTAGTFDLYWIAVDPATQGRGLGRALLAEVERRLAAEGARLLVAETAGKPSYTATRAFYERTGWELAARVPDFYAAGDDKLIYVRRLGH